MTARPSPHLSMRRLEGVAWVELNRPDRGNALSADLVEALIDALDEMFADDSLHTVVLVGAGRHFCTGFDLEGIEQTSDGELLHRFVRIEVLFDQLWRAPLRTVAIVNGRAIGAGADLCVACDHRVLAPAASLRFPGAGFGIVLGTRRLAIRVGQESALKWVADGDTIDATCALAAGLASRVAATPPPTAESGVDPTALDQWRAALLPAPPAVDRPTYPALRAAALQASTPDAARGADADLAALVRSASAPGLRERILRYRDRSTRR